MSFTSGLGLACVWIALFVTPSQAQPADPNIPVTNGSVYALARHDQTLYVGGQFSEISSATGAGIPIDGNTGASVVGFPQVVGRVFTSVSDGAGGWYIGGLFTKVGGLARTNLAHVASNLTVAAWNPSPNDAVLALVTDISTGAVYAGGAFTTIGGQSRARLAELDASGAATAFNPGANSLVRALYVTGGSLYAGGDFTFVGATPRNRLVQITRSTGAIGTWNPNCNGSVQAIEVVARPGPTSTWLVGGTFTSIGGQSRANLAEITTAGLATSWSPNPNGTVFDIQELGQTYVCGSFTVAGGLPRNRIAAFSPTTGAVTSWDPNADDAVDALVFASSYVVLGGKFKHVGGLACNRIARIDATTGAPAAFGPGMNEEVKTVSIDNSGARLYAGGEFSGLTGVARQNLAAIDVTTGNILPFAPDPNAAVRVLQLATYGSELYTVYAGGDFTSIGGQPRGRLAALDAYTGAPSSWDPQVNSGSVLALSIQDTTAFFGGTFSGTHGSGFPYADVVDLRTGGIIGWIIDVDAPVLSMAVSGGLVYMGGLFTMCQGQARNHIASVGRSVNAFLGIFDPNANGTVRTLIADGGSIVAGGDFTTIGGQPRNRIARVSGLGTADPSFDPNANGIVRCLARSGTETLAAGDFTTIGGQARSRLASLDPTTGVTLPLNVEIADREVFALSAVGRDVFIGGTFRGVGDLPQAQFAGIKTDPSPSCPPTGGTTYAGPGPRAISTGDFNNDGIRDLAVCNAAQPPEVRILRGSGGGGLGDGTFVIQQTLPLTGLPTKVAVADFDADGFEDLAIAQSGSGGMVSIFLNQGGTFAASTQLPLVGRVDGLAVNDMDQDGILDLVACLLDSAGVVTRGGLELVRGTGSSGVWDGGFNSGTRLLGSWDAYGRQVVLSDLNLDGTPDIEYSPGGLGVWTAPGGVVLCLNPTAGVPATSGFGIAMGDLNGDGLSDVVYTAGRRIRTRIKNGVLGPGCPTAQPFNSFVSYSVPSTPRDLALLDFDQDGDLDVVYTLDSLQDVEMLPGLGDGTFGPSQQVALMDAWGIAVGDFVGDGRPDVVITQRECRTVSVLTYPNAPLLAGDLSLITPNGGEVWPAVFPALPPDAGRTPPLLQDDGSEAGAPTSQTLASTQQIMWTKAVGVQGVDVSVSRNDGATWQPIATNVAGTAMPWIVTPPSSNNARIRVRDAAVTSRADASNASFQVATGLVGADGLAPGVVAFSMKDANPSRGRMRFRLDLPVASDAEVQALDVRGRVVRNLARGRLPAGVNEVVWNGADDRGAVARSGIYFVRAHVGDFTEVRKVVLVR